MGTGKTSQRSKANAAKKKYKKAKWTSNRAKDIDQIQVRQRANEKMMMMEEEEGEIDVMHLSCGWLWLAGRDPQGGGDRRPDLLPRRR